MAKVSYKESSADYVVLKFKCSCGKEITTNLIPVKERYNLEKTENSFDHSDYIVCPKCNEKYLLRFYDNMYEAYCEIPSLTNDKDILYLREIPDEYAKGYDNALIDYIEEIVRIKEVIEKIEKQDTLDKTFLYRMTYSYVISLMDAYLHNTFMYNIKNYDVFKREFLLNCKRNNRKVNWEEQLKMLSMKSFQNLNKVSIPYYKGTFGIDLYQDDIIQNAVQVRNAIIHNNGREKDGYLYEITKSIIKELISHVETLVSFVNMEMRNVVFEKIILPNIEGKTVVDNS